jgi:hypothetical protein
VEEENNGREADGSSFSDNCFGESAVSNTAFLGGCSGT